MVHRSGRLVVIECKRETKHPTPAQREWLDGFERLAELAAPMSEDVEPWHDMYGRTIKPPLVAVFVARPSNRQEIFDTLATYAGV